MSVTTITNSENHYLGSLMRWKTSPFLTELGLSYTFPKLATDQLKLIILIISVTYTKLWSHKLDIKKSMITQTLFHIQITLYLVGIKIILE